MNYEKAYKDALERMKSWARGEHPECFTEAQKAAEFIFPELAESEDERIRKELLESFKYQQRESRTDKEWLNGIKLSEVVAWLEKQVEKDKLIKELGKYKVKYIQEVLSQQLEKQDNKTEEYIFRPIAGSTIDNAARQAIDKVTNGENIVFSFNGFYMKIYKGTTIDNIINSYNDFCKKQCKPMWSKEDEDNLNMAIYFMRSENTPYSPTDVEPVVEWLCGLKQRMEKQ